MKDQLLPIARQLAKLYKVRAGAMNARRQLERDLEIAKIDKSPTEGWPGKNAEERKLAQEKAFISDQDITKTDNMIDDCLEELSEATGQIEALEAERRAIEWSIRDSLVDAMMRRHIQSDNCQQVDGVFDDVADAETMNEVAGDINAEYPLSDPWRSEDGTILSSEIPF
jgi:hypothetical protein